MKGEEIGMRGVDELASIESRYPARTPLQWNDSVNAGFSTNPKPWLPVAEDYTENNVKLQESQEISHLKVFQQLISLRQNPTFKYGSLTIGSSSDNNLLVYKRELGAPNAEIFVVVLNLSEERIANIDLSAIFGGLPIKMRVAVRSTESSLSLG